MHAGRLPLFAALSIALHAATLTIAPRGVPQGREDLTSTGGFLNATLERVESRAGGEEALSTPAANASVSTKTSTAAQPARAGVQHGLDLPLPDKWFTADELDVRAQPLTEVHAYYPRAIVGTATAARVQVRLFIDERGVVRKAEIPSGAPATQFEQIALNAWREVRFSPAIKDGVAVKSQKLLEMDFTP